MAKYSTCKRLRLLLLALMTSVSLFSGMKYSSIKVKAADEGYIDIYRMFNPNSGEHLYSGDENEVNTLFGRQWGDVEGAKWESPVSRIISDSDPEGSLSKPVYRLYNRRSGEHLYTSDENEKRVLTGRGWVYENGTPAWYSDPDGALQVVRLYNTRSGEHLFTADQNEVNVLLGKGNWHNDGIVCMAKPAVSPAISPKQIERIVWHTPIYYGQFDRRWSGAMFGGRTFGSTGCAPTSLAMAIAGITHNGATPYNVGYYLYTYTNDYNKSYGIGTTGLGYKHAADHWGVANTPVNSEQDIINALSHGKIIVINVGYGYFVRSYSYTHSIVLFQYNGGNCQVYDPETSSRNGWYSVQAIWNQRSTAPIDWIGGYCAYALG